VIVSLVVVFLSCSSFEQENQTVKAQATVTSAGVDVNVLYAGSLISVMETKLGPAFSHLGYDYKGEGHGSIQDANMIIDGQRFPDVFISVGEKPITKLGIYLMTIKRASGDLKNQHNRNNDPPTILTAINHMLT
jgi:ABC-type molybdate transport system substrate-binding protein